MKKQLILLQFVLLGFAAVAQSVVSSSDSSSVPDFANYDELTQTSDASDLESFAGNSTVSPKNANGIFSEKIKVYPNPVKDFLYIKNSPVNSRVSVEIYNILGRKMLSESFTSTSFSTEQRIDLNDLQKGIYLIRVFDEQMNILATHSISKDK